MDEQTLNKLYTRMRSTPEFGSLAGQLQKSCASEAQRTNLLNELLELTAQAYRLGKSGESLDPPAPEPKEVPDAGKEDKVEGAGGVSSLGQGESIVGGAEEEAETGAPHG